MHDIMDGFFPSELQRRYPDGIPFEVLRYTTSFSLACEDEEPAIGLLFSIMTDIPRDTTPGANFIKRPVGRNW